MSEGTGAAGGTGAPNDGGTQNQGQQGTQQTGGTGHGAQQTGQQNQGQQGDQQTGGTGQGESIETLPPWAQKLIKDTRAEAASARTSAKATAAQEARDGILQELGKALGFVKDQPLDPAKLADDLAKDRSKLRDATVQLAVLRAASKAGGDPDALLDSRSFLDSLASLDPASEGFSGQVSAAIAQAVKDNPRLGAGTPVGSGGGEIPGGTQDPGAGRPGSMDDVMKQVKRLRSTH